MISSGIQYIAKGNFGDVLLLKTPHPRKELLDRLGATHADKVYVDTKDGRSAHVGYIVNQQWFTLYRVAGVGVEDRPKEIA